MDYFGSTPPSVPDFFSADLVAADYSGPADPHGYGVLSVIAATHGGSSLVAGMNPGPVRLRAVDVSSLILQSGLNRLLQVIREEGGLAIVNRSLGSCGDGGKDGTNYASDERISCIEDEARGWIEKVRETGLKDSFLLFGSSARLETMRTTRQSIVRPMLLHCYRSPMPLESRLRR